MSSARPAIGIAALITLAALVTWQATGGDVYTKYQVVENVETAVDPDDPLAAAGFYGDESPTETITRDTFRFGLLPTPGGIFDKHIVSVVSVCGPVWVIALLAVWLARRRNRQIASL
jgi:hypothetical protein